MSKIIFNGVDYAGGSGNYFNPVIYSDTERKIGVWRDNKPLYQRTFVQHSTDVSGAGVSFDVSALDIDTCVDVFGTCDRIVTGVGTLIYPFNAYEDASLRTYLAYSKFDTHINFNIRFYVGESTSTQYITILYTKTTDVAGSGDYNTYGVPTHHYSTSEQVIGTYFGKPLYEKTWDNVSIGINGTNWVYFNDPVDIDNVISFDAYYNNSDRYLHCAISEFQRSNSNGIMFSGFSGMNRTVNRITAQYTKTTD